MVPRPVGVTVLLAEMVAGPDFTLSDTGSPLLAVGGMTLKADPKALAPTGVKAPIVWEPLLTTKLVVTSAAGPKLVLPAWLAASTTVPAPVRVTVFPVMVAGPLFTLNASGNPLLELGALILNGDAPNAFAAIGVNAEMVCDAPATMKLVVTSGAASKSAFPD